METEMSREVLSVNIRYYRKLNKMTQKQLAEALYIVPQTISKWESGLADPDVEKLCAMADIFGISMDALIRRVSDAARRTYIAIDGGGTKTAFVLFGEDGSIIDSLTLGGCNPNACGMEKTQSVLAEGIDRLLSQGALVEGLYAGIAGASAGENKTELQKFLHERYPYIKSRVEGDIFNVINSIANVEKCIAVISGTGSVVYACDGKELHRYGGWGYLFDEAGSGFDIGRDLFRYCLECEDMGKLTDELYVALSEMLGGHIFNHISSIYAKGKDYIASFAPIVFEMCERGNPVAVDIVTKTVGRLAGLINRAYEGGPCGNTAIIAGGLISRKDILEPMLRKSVNADVDLIFADQPPIYGAAVKCMKLFGENFDRESFFNNFIRRLEE